MFGGISVELGSLSQQKDLALADRSSLSAIGGRSIQMQVSSLHMAYARQYVLCLLASEWTRYQYGQSAGIRFCCANAGENSISSSGRPAFTLATLLTIP